MKAATFAQYRAFDDKYSRMMEYLSSEGRYWIDKDQWYLEADSFRQAGINTEKRKSGKLADFSGYQSEQLKNEMKYFLLYSMKNGLMSVSNIYTHYTVGIRRGKRLRRQLICYAKKKRLLISVAFTNKAECPEAFFMRMMKSGR